MSLKKIGITMRISDSQSYTEKRDAISHDWGKFLNKLNLLPIFIPNSIENINEYLSESGIEGIIISGGDNLGDDLIRDQTEKKVIDFGIKNKIPILGVCRGMQAINVFFGGNIKKNKSVDHVSKRHNIKFISNDVPHITDVIEVNSFHRNLIEENDLGKDLKIFAKCQDDESVEGIRHTKLPIIGVMWHPERDMNDFQIHLLDFLKGNDK
ncbi:gamma-glutamyl-gamma-aminobutyrate hydrolase family protein [Nitrosarchaeum sp.]|uniref:glutamine amidotransferase-related protein n=1 Tax=Nitrosarchaeum sp. TaxID=2026886 RepID=UPI00247E9546|nr:gamma-glutamyl-gamma-aminobutyrate hydrolase family protein [Nitrosarchaeum sp.]MCV0411903.1 gamma-glutamyl-gamma-aminobutyrate hydrolase family protein [Nitrosarchaeum sp.]